MKPKRMLETYLELPVREKCLLNNKAVLEQIEIGIKDAAAGRISKRGSFVRFANEDADAG